MSYRRITFAPREMFRSDFPMEWVGVVIFALIALFWAASIHFRLAFEGRDFLVPGLAIFAITVARMFRADRVGLVAEYFFLTVAATAVFGVISYLSMTTDRPLVDGALMAADRAVGFDWHADYRWLVQHDRIASVLQFAYNSLVYQGLYFGVLFGLMARTREMREMFWLVAAAGVLTSGGAALFPALGPFKTYGINAAFLPAMEQLRGPNLHFALATLTGVVSFPSFHTTMSLLYMYGFRRAGAIGWAIVALNVLMLPAIPFFGGHYLVDMFAGAGVALASLAIVRAWTAKWPALSNSENPAAILWEPAAGDSVVRRRFGGLGSRFPI